MPRTAGTGSRRRPFLSNTNVTKGRAIVLAAFTVWPYIYMVIFIVAFARIATTHVQPAAASVPATFRAIIPLHLITMFEVFVLTVYYVGHLFKTAVVPQDKRAPWAIVLIFANMFAFPVYWYLYIWQPLRTKVVGLDLAEG